jgi:predicted O-methyltransferase YrrM
MKFQNIEKILKHIPHMKPQEGKLIYQFILENDIHNILELGFAHGTSTCYMAAALDEIGSGSIITIDQHLAKKREPDIFTLLKTTNFENYVQPIFCDTSYNWELLKILEKQNENGRTKTIFDFCFIDGAHSWEVDGLAFFLVEKLLKAGGWILFDDVDWKFGDSKSIKNMEFVLNMPDEQKNTAQVEKIFHLLVSQHSDFEDFQIKNRWGWARKKSIDITKTVNPVAKIYTDQNIGQDIIDLAKKIVKKIIFRNK